MAQTSTTSVVNALKYTYGADRLEIILNQEVVLWNILKKSMVPMGGRGQYITPLYTQFPEAFGGITQGGTLPTSTAPTTTEATFSLQEFAGRYEVTWKLLQDARTDKFAFEQAVQMMDRGFRIAITQDISNELLDDGRGRLAVLPAADNSSPVTVNAVPRVRKGMVLDLMDTDDDTKHLDSGTVSAVDPINKTVTISGTITGTAASDYFVREDTCDDSLNDSLHLNGLVGIIDNENPATVVGNYGGINRSTAGNEFWESSVLSNSGTNRALTEDLILQAIHNVRLKGGGKVNAILMNQPIFRRYYEILAEERFRPVSGMSGFSADGGPKGEASKPGDTGKTAFTFSGIPIHVDVYSPANTIFLLDTKCFRVAHGENKVPRPVSDIYDVPFFRDVANTASYEVAWYWQGELVCNNPAAQAKIEDVAES